MHGNGTLRAIALCALTCPAQAAWAGQGAPAPAGPAATDLDSLRQQIETERASIAAQRGTLEAQERRLDALEATLLDRMRGMGLPVVTQLQAAPQAGAQTGQQPPSSPPPEGVHDVGVKPADANRQPEVAVLADQGGILTKAGRITLEPTLEYTRADRNRFVFRGIEIPQSVLVGIFDINESRQDILTAAAVARLGVTNRLEIGARVPFVYRDDGAVLVPLVQNPPQSGVGTINTSAHGSGLGDVEILARYQLTNGTHGWPFLIGGLQVITPTGSSPFGLPRDPLGNASKSATGSGFWGVSPSVTILLPSDPATLFGVIGYTFNFGRNVNTRISDAQIDRVEPGDAPGATLGVGIALNERTSVSFAYAHTWQLGTKSRIRPVSIQNGIETIGDPIISKTRDLQFGRFLFGISYRVTDRTTINWSVEIGATQDAPDVRTILRIPIAIN